MIKINFCDMFRDFNPADNLYLDIIKKNFDGYELTENPDFLIYSVFGTNHLKYKNCVRIFVSGEAISPDFNICDYASTFDRISFGDRYIRRPVWIDESFPEHTQITDEEALSRRFCNFVYSNDQNGDGARLRKTFAQKLMQYKKVDCPGKILHNFEDDIDERFGDWRKSKVNFLKKYKFTIAFENSSCYGYTTEKMTQPLSAGSIPIYWGSPDVTVDFNQNAFINANDMEDKLDELVKQVIELDKNDQKYLDMLHADPMQNTFDRNEKQAYEQFFINIFKKGNKPFCKDPLEFSKRMSVDSLSRKDKIKYFLFK